MLPKLRILAAAFVAAGLASVSFAAAPAGAAVARGRAPSIIRPNFTNKHGVQLCDNESSPLCMNGFDGDGGAVKSFARTPGDAQNVSVLAASNCGGSVTASCPFTVGSGFNTEFEGDTIVTINLDANTMFNFLASSTDGSMEEASGGSGQLWVLVGSLTIGGSGAHIVNVAVTDEESEEMYACDNGTSGDQMLVLHSTLSTCTWFADGGS